MPLTIKLLHSILSDLEYKIVSQKGSHIKYRKTNNTIMTPNHKELKPGTGSTILKDISVQNNISYDALIKKYNIKL
ncbi:MAG: type II toxin-antitoxin system HicA family toxin [Candidatus Absconditabacterales bacterium]